MPLNDPISQSPLPSLSKTFTPIGLTFGAFSLFNKIGLCWKCSSTLRNPSEVETSQLPSAASHRIARSLSCQTFPSFTFSVVLFIARGIINGGRRHIPVIDSQSVRMIVVYPNLLCHLAWKTICLPSFCIFSLACNLFCRRIR